MAMDMTNTAQLRPLRSLRFEVIFGLILGLCPGLRAQGPKVSYYYNPQTELSWARCDAYMEGGSRQRIPFMPVVCAGVERAPLGTRNYSHDIAVDGPLVFIGNGISKGPVWDSYKGRRMDWTVGDIDVSGKIVMFGYDFLDALEKTPGMEYPLAARIAQAASRKASAVVLFSARQDYPFLSVSYKDSSEIPDIPVITITQNSALSILNGAGLDGDSLIKDWEGSKTPPQSQELISRLALRIEGNFDRAETANFRFQFLKGSMPRKQMDELARTNEKALAFLRQIFRQENDLKWQRLFVVYFRDFDSKIFYTHHWGSGLASKEGIFMVQKSPAPNYPLAVHENAHILIGQNWGDSSSFLAEGIGRYTEALAEDKDKNHREVIAFIKRDELVPLSELLTFNIGQPGLKTDVGYPAAGSFVGFLIERYGPKALKECYSLEDRSPEQKSKEDTWLKATGKALPDLEKEWLTWLAETHKPDESIIRSVRGETTAFRTFPR